MNILAIESSCDETAAAIIKDGTTILSQSIATSSSMHETWGGIVPEVAAREQLRSIIPVIMETLSVFDPTLKTHTGNIPYRHVIGKNIDAIAVTVGPGLIGSLLIGVEAAKTIAYVTNKPIIPVNHVLAHMYANFIVSHPPACADRSSANCHPISFPAISLVASGGHTELFLMNSPKILKWLGGTMDDAAGEAFDKTARLLGFGSRGGLAIQESARRHVGTPIPHLPRPLQHDKTLNFSFSGLKTAILREVNALKDKKQFNDITIQQLSYEVQEAITDVLVAKTLHAAEAHSARSILISGGVAANLRLREKFQSAISTVAMALAGKQNLTFHSPPISLCTDNAAYIGSCAYFYGNPVDWHIIEAQPNLSVEI
jgi:N6-L-threonylcarbamoyladenine synthase